MESDESARRFRFRMFLWDGSDSDEPLVGDLAESGYVEAHDVRSAVASVDVGSVKRDATRLVIDVQRQGMSLPAKVADWSLWRVVATWLDGQGDRAEHVREHLQREVPLSLVAVDDEGNLGVAVGLAAPLEWEAMDDLEEVLEAVIGDGVYDSLGAVETNVLTTPPSLERLRSELIDAARHPTSQAFPPDAVRHEDVDPEGPRDGELIVELLLKLASQEVSSPESLAKELSTSSHVVEQALASIDQWGLALLPSEHGPPLLLDAGRQFVRRGGRVPSDALNFLSRPIDDLDAREALRRAGAILVGEFTDALCDGTLVEHARSVVPPAFRGAVDMQLAAALSACASALMARLAAGHPAGCVAEEILTVRLIEIAEELLEAAEDRLGAEATANAIGELRGLFELFEDDDVLQMFEMSEPADASVAGHDPINRQLGVVDQRVEAWFDAFGGTTPTGHLTEPRRERWP
jgi:hypothetical protein